MQQVADMKQTPTPTVKPSPPWAVFGSAAAILIMAIIGLSNHHLFSFQEPYSLDAQSEPTIEIVDAPTLFDTNIKRTAQNQPARLGAIEIAQEGTETETKDKTKVNLDFDAILAGIKQNDEKVKSGEGRTVFTYESFTELGDLKESRTQKARLIFDEHQDRIRMELAESTSLQRITTPRTTFITTEKGTFYIQQLRIDHKSSYGFNKIREIKEGYLLRNFFAPRRWTRISDTEDLATSLKESNYRILTREMLDGIPCYVLEGKKEPPPGAEQQMPEISRIWIAPEHGFRMQKRERRWTKKEDSVDGSLEKGTPFVARNTFSYQQIGGAWLLKSTKQETARVDPEGREHITSRITLELQDFKINHAIPPETFAFDIPDDAQITVDGFDERMSKQEFLEWLGQQ